MRQLKDNIIAADKRAQQEDPLVMHIVIDYKSCFSKQELYYDVLDASLAAERELSVQAEFKEQFDQWWDNSFRKIVLKAKPGKWQAIAARPDVITSGQVIVCTPVRRSQRDSVFSKLQVLTDLNQLENDLKTETSEINFLIKKEISLGKTIAQISHAILKHALTIQDLYFIQNRSKDCFSFNEAKEIQEKAGFTVIHDAGLTEVKSGTLTVAIL
jgi:peptidyl-tRNA hydrolase